MTENCSTSDIYITNVIIRFSKYNTNRVDNLTIINVIGY